MIKHRIIYILTLVGVIFFYILYPVWFSWYLLIVILLLIPFDLLSSLPGMITRELFFNTPRVLEMNSKAAIIVTTYQKKSYPARCIRISLQTIRHYGLVYHNSSNKKNDNKNTTDYTLGANSTNRFEIEVDTTLSGVTTYVIKNMRVVSLLGLFALPRPIRYEKSILVMPPPVKPPRTIALPRGMVFSPKPGGGYAEDHDLRAYRIGDPVKSIHWKVSAKFNTIIVREPLVPPPHSRLVIVTKWINQAQQDIILGRLRWISDYLLKWELPYFIRLDIAGEIEEITNHDELEDFLYKMLCYAPSDLQPRPYNPGRFTWVLKIDARGGSL